MTTAEILNRECEEIERENGIFIPPWQMEQLMKTTHRIIAIITASHTCMNYYETTLILRMALAAIRETTGKEAI